MIGFWTRHWWWITLPTMILALGFAYVSPALDYEFFCKGEDPCFREWVSATSGWVAAGAAFFTIRMMLKTQRENVDIQLHPRVTLARIVQRRAEADKKRLLRLEDLKHLSGDQAVALTNQQSQDFKKLRRSFHQDDFDEFERIEFVGATYLRSVRTSLDRVANELRMYQGDADGNVRKNVLWPKDFPVVADALDRAEKHNARLAKASNRFIRRWRHRGVSF